MQTAGYVFDQVRSLMDDQEGQVATDDYLRPFLQMALDDLQAICLNDPNIGQIKASVVIPAVPAGTQSLAPELLPSGKLALLSDPIELRERKVGDQDSNYVRMIPYGVPLPNSSQQSLNRFYTFTGTDIILPGSSQDEDIWVWGAFKPAPIKDKDTPLIPDTEIILKYGAAKLAFGSRGNVAREAKMEAYQMQVQSAWMRTLYKIQQSIRVVNRPWRPKTQFWFDSPTAY